jgi:site-specific DNA-methyltransferase (adenine-specific)
MWKDKNAAHQNHHPTVKPITLMRYLIKLVVPPNGIVLDPFLGSGTTGVAAIQENISWLGFEMNPEYADIARRRTGHASF